MHYFDPRGVHRVFAVLTAAQTAASYQCRFHR